MFQAGGGCREDVGLVGVSILLGVHLYKEQRIIIDLFMVGQNRWRPIEMSQGDCTYLTMSEGAERHQAMHGAERPFVCPDGALKQPEIPLK